MLHDPRAATIYERWQRYYRGPHGDYGPEGHFRGWTAKVTNRFFTIEEVWPDWAIDSCCVALGLEPIGALDHLQSVSEDECIRVATEGRHETSLQEASAAKQPSSPLERAIQRVRGQV
jgi:hypothetical protein